MGIQYNYRSPPLDAVLMYDGRNNKSYNAGVLNNLLYTTSPSIALSVVEDANGYMSLTSPNVDPITTVNLNSYPIFSVSFSFTITANTSGVLFAACDTLAAWLPSTQTLSYTGYTSTQTALAGVDAGITTKYNASTQDNGYTGFANAQNAKATIDAGITTMYNASTQDNGYTGFTSTQKALAGVDAGITAKYNASTQDNGYTGYSASTTITGLDNFAYNPLADAMISMNIGNSLLTRVKSGDYDASITTTVPNGINTVVAVFRNGAAVSNLSVWLNGVWVSDTPVSSNIRSFTTDPIQLFGRVLNADWFNGGIRSIALYGRELNQAEILALAEIN